MNIKGIPSFEIEKIECTENRKELVMMTNAEDEEELCENVNEECK